MNYYDFLNKKLETTEGKQFTAHGLKKMEKNPFVSPLFGEDLSSVKVDGASIFTKATKDEIAKINYDNLASDATISDENQLNPLEFVLKSFLSIEKIKTLADTNKDGTISAEEAKDYVEALAGKDGNFDDISLEDFETLLKENNINLEDYAQNPTDEQLPLQESNNQDYTQSLTGSRGADYSNADGLGAGYKSGGAEVKTLDTMSLPELETEKAKRDDTLKQKQEAVNAVHSGQNENVKAAKADADKARNEYENAIKGDAGAKKFAKQVLNNNTKIAKNEEELNKNAQSINNKEIEISKQESSLETLKGGLDALTSSLSSLPALSGKDEDKEKDAKIKSQKSEIQKKISSKKSEISKQEKQISKLKKELDKLNKDKSKLENEKKKLEEEKAKLDAMVQKYCTEETKAKLEAFNKAKQNVEEVKAKELQKAQSELTTAKDSVKEIDTKISQKKAEEVKNEYSGTDSALKPGLFKGALAGKEALVTELCRKYGVDPALVASIIGLESGWGTSNLAQHNNFGGYRAAGDLGKNGNGFGYFSTAEKGLEKMISNLAKYTRYSDVKAVDFNNLDAIGRHYCEEGVWANSVRNMYNSRVKKYLA